MPTYNEKVIEIRANVKTPDLSIPNSDIYNEEILEALQKLAPHTDSKNDVESELVTISGVVVSGYVGVSFTTSSDFNGSINGTTITGAYTININSQNTKTLNAINYTVTTGNILIFKLVK
jgi:hypothetical protein